MYLNYNQNAKITSTRNAYLQIMRGVFNSNHNIDYERSGGLCLSQRVISTTCTIPLLRNDKNTDITDDP